MTNDHQLRRILFASDFSPTAAHALDCAIELAARLGTPLEILHVIALPRFPLPDGSMASTVFDLPAIVRAATEGVTVAADRARSRGVRTVETNVVEGDPAEQIVRAAESRTASLIVVGTHGRRALSRLLLGSVADRVVRTAPCPVVVAHLPAD